jgi:hypothetical protein
MLAISAPAASAAQPAGHAVLLTATGSAELSFRLSFHQALLGPTGAHWLDDPPDLSCKDSTR